MMTCRNTRAAVRVACVVSQLWLSYLDLIIEAHVKYAYTAQGSFNNRIHPPSLKKKTGKALFYTSASLGFVQGSNLSQTLSGLLLSQNSIRSCYKNPWENYLILNSSPVPFKKNGKLCNMYPDYCCFVLNFFTQ